MRPGGFEPPTRGLEVRRSIPSTCYLRSRSVESLGERFKRATALQCRPSRLLHSRCSGDWTVSHEPVGLAPSPTRGPNLNHEPRGQPVAEGDRVSGSICRRPPASGHFLTTDAATRLAIDTSGRQEYVGLVVRKEPHDSGGHSWGTNRPVHTHAGVVPRARGGRGRTAHPPAGRLGVLASRGR
jgi:hypothetical protein